MTRQLANGYIRASVKYIDDRNQFILPLPLDQSRRPRIHPGFSNYGALNTNEGIDLRVPTPAGDLTLPLDNGLKTQATWFTVDASIDLADDWHIQNTAQAMQNDQERNALDAEQPGDCRRLREQPAMRTASRRAAPASSSSPITSTPRATGCRSTPRTVWWPSPANGTSRSRSRRSRTSFSCGSLRPAHAWRWGRTSPTTPRTTTGTSPTS